MYGHDIMDNKGWSRYSIFIAGKVASELRRQNLSQAALGKRMGRTQQYVSYILSGKANLTLETVSLLEEALNISLSRITSNTECYDQQILRDDHIIYRAGCTSSLRSVTSADSIIRRFETGDRPFLTIGDDSKKYLCKAAKYGSESFSLERELIGSVFANIWGIADYELILMEMQPQHRDSKQLSVEDPDKPCLGREWQEAASDIKDGDLSYIAHTREAALDIMKIALFDCWLSNEDRLNNNLNLLYSIDSKRITAIDHAGIFNTGFSAPLLPLSLYDSVLYSNLFTEISNGEKPSDSELSELKIFYEESVSKCRDNKARLWKMTPKIWNIPRKGYDEMMDFIFSENWIDNTMDNFLDIMKKSLL